MDFDNSLSWDDFSVILLDKLNIPVNHPKKDIFLRLCWEYGHSCGYSEIYNVALDLVELL